MRASIFNFVFAGTLALALTVPNAHPSTIWTGTNVAFYHTDENGAVDTWAADVKISRSVNGGGLINVAQSETFGTFGTSPKGTQWIQATLAQYTNNPGGFTFSSCPLEAHKNPSQYANNTAFVVHLTSAADDIYLQLNLTNWGGELGQGDHTFGYIRSTPPVVTAPTPTVSVTNPAPGAVFGAPASFTIGASATVSSGSVTNVRIFTNNVLLASLITGPYLTNLTGLGIGTYAIKAAATAAGISATSAIVTVTVAALPSITLTNPAPNSVFIAPANLKLGATASFTGAGAVTNVQFFANTTRVGSATASPFTATSSSLGAGAYSLTAVATASGLSATSAPISVSVIVPASVTIPYAGIDKSNFLLTFLANTGLTYVVQASSNLLSWTPVITNVASTNLVTFTNAATKDFQFYRIGLLPNP